MSDFVAAIILWALFPSGYEYCGFVWTGGWTDTWNDWNNYLWLYTDDSTGSSQSMEYSSWAHDQKSYVDASQFALFLQKKQGYNFYYGKTEYIGELNCFICEC